MEKIWKMYDDKINVFFNKSFGSKKLKSLNAEPFQCHKVLANLIVYHSLHSIS